MEISSEDSTCPLSLTQYTADLGYKSSVLNPKAKLTPLAICHSSTSLKFLPDLQGITFLSLLCNPNLSPHPTPTLLCHSGFFIFLHFETASHCVVQANLKLAILYSGITGMHHLTQPQ
jgi:hypothetical protein